MGYEMNLKAPGNSIENSVEGEAPQLRANPEDYAGDGQAGERVGVGEPGKIPGVPCPDEGDAEDDDDSAPDIGGKVQGVGFKSFAGVALGDDIQGVGAGHVDREGDEKDDDGSDGGLNVDGVEKEAMEGLVDDIDGGENEQAGFNEGGKIFEFAMAVGVALVRGLVGDADGEKRDDGGDKVKAGMEGFREDAEAVRADDQKRFQAKQDGGGCNAQQGGALLFLDGGEQALGKDHGVRLHHVEKTRPMAGVVGGAKIVLWAPKTYKKLKIQGPKPKNNKKSNKRANMHKP